MIQPSHPRDSNNLSNSSFSPPVEELRTLPLREAFVVERQRVRIEGTLETDQNRTMVTSLSVHVTNPQGTDIVRYKLTPRPSGDDAADLAQRLGQTLEHNVSDSYPSTDSEQERIFGLTLLRELKSWAEERDFHFQRSDSQSEKSASLPHNKPNTPAQSESPDSREKFAITPSSNDALDPKPEASRLEPSETMKQPMRRQLPPFSRFVDDPYTLDKNFFSKEIVNGVRVEAKATIHPREQVSIIKAWAFPNGKAEQFQFKMRYPEAERGQLRHEAEVIKYLSSMTWKVMEEIAYQGPAKALEEFSNSDVDKRLRSGKLRQEDCEIFRVLPSGTSVSLEIGDSVATVRIQSRDTQHPTRVWWTIEAKDGILEPTDTRLNKARRAIDNLILGSAYQRHKAVESLDRLGKVAFEAPTLNQLGLSEPFRWAKTLKNTSVKISEPIDSLQVVDLLDGFQHLSFTFKKPTFSWHQPHLPYHMMVGISPGGSMKVEMTTPLCNHFEAILPPEKIHDFQGYIGTLRHMGELFDQQTSGAMQQLQAFLEGRSSTKHGHSHIRAHQLRLPASNNTRQNLALENASHIMRILVSEYGGSTSQGKALFPSSSQCELVISQSFAYPGLRMHLMISQTGIRGIELVAPGKRPRYTHTFHFDRPITPRDNGADLRGILSLYNAPPDERGPTTGLTAERLKESALFKYLEYLELVFQVEH